jgi:hypothetical protein
MSRIDIMQEHGLDADFTARNWLTHMTRTPMLIMLVAAAALAGCNKGHTIVASGGPPGDNLAEVAANGPVALPPAITSTKVYRCADNKIVYVDWLSDNKSANIRTEKGGAPTALTAAEPGKTMTAAGGYSLDGKASANEAKIAIPGHPSQSCKA